MPPPSLSDLPFVTAHLGKATDLWAVEPTGNWAADNAAGAAHAAALLSLMFATNNLPLLGHVTKRIAERGQWSGVEVGFYEHIARSAITAP